jgi:hypothetical protein
MARASKRLAAFRAVRLSLTGALIFLEATPPRLLTEAQPQHDSALSVRLSLTARKAAKPRRSALGELTYLASLFRF